MDHCFSSVDEAILAIARGEFVIVVDDEARENEGDLVIAAEHMTSEKMAFMLRHTSGLVCAPLTLRRSQELELPLMVERNADPFITAFTISCDVKKRTSTGISAHDRAETVRALADPGKGPGDFRRPGHIFPLIANEGGVLKRAGHTEATIDLVRYAQLKEVGVLCELVNEDCSMARLEELVQFSKRERIPIISINDLIAYRRKKERLVRCLATTEIPTDFGPFTAHVYHSLLDGTDHFSTGSKRSEAWGIASKRKSLSSRPLSKSPRSRQFILHLRWSTSVLHFFLPLGFYKVYILFAVRGDWTFALV